jgi:SAM-dependent methyltransferase
MKKKKTKKYSDKTFNARDPLKRYLQHRRLKDALSELGDLDTNFTGKFLDFGGGNGELAKMLANRYPNAEISCYEPAPRIFAEAEQNLGGLDNVFLVSELKALEAIRFEYIFCLEVFEQLPDHPMARAIEAIDCLLSPRGTVIIGVPNELFVQALVKGLYRMTQRYGLYDARPSNIARAAVGRPPTDRPCKEIALGFPYYKSHMGFDHRRLRLRLENTFEVVRSSGSPFGKLGGPLNSEIMFVLRKPAKPLSKA